MMTTQQEKVFCHDCNKECILSGCTTGYGIDKDNNKICYLCCGKRDEKDMLATGKAVFYLSDIKDVGIYGVKMGIGKVSNWPGTLAFEGRVRVGRQNFTGKRYDVWFMDNQGNNWWGVTFGDNTQICHCKMIKK